MTQTIDVSGIVAVDSVGKEWTITRLGFDPGTKQHYYCVKRGDQNGFVWATHAKVRISVPNTHTCSIWIAGSLLLASRNYINALSDSRIHKVNREYLELAEQCLRIAVDEVNQ